MDVKNVTRKTTASFGLNYQKISNDMVTDEVFSLTNERLFTKGNTLSGLCTNCENNTHCDWQRENKIFCEHYQ